MNRLALTSSICGIAVALLFTTVHVSATELSAPVRTCITADCQATVLGGWLNKSGLPYNPAVTEWHGVFVDLPMPWVVQVFAGPNECLRLRVTSQAAGINTELVAIAPVTRRVWRNDSSGIAGCTTCPLLKIRTNANESGWFLVQVNSSTGAAVNGAFTVSYARYAASNANCQTPSPPLVTP
jgi:hypothetical protein